MHFTCFWEIIELHVDRIEPYDGWWFSIETPEDKKDSDLEILFHNVSTLLRVHRDTIEIFLHK